MPKPRPISSPPSADSIECIRSYQAGDQQALGRLVERYYDRVSRIVRVRMGAFLRGVESVEDLVQETFLVALRDFDRFEIREDAGLIQWLARLAERRIANAARHHRAGKRDRGREVRMKSVRIGGADSMVSWDLAAETTEIPERAVRAEVHAELEMALQGLPELQREVVLLRAYGGGSWAFIAEELGLASDEAGRKLYGRARARLARTLRDRLR